MIKKYYRLTKPGIIYGNALTAIAGFLLASKGHIDFWLLVATLLGVSAVIGSACVFNNVIDRDIDRVMSRTKTRSLVTGEITVKEALSFAVALGAIGFIILSAYTNLLTVIIGFIALVDYVILYGLSKRRTVHSTIVGSISGAAPIMAGYCAVTGRLDAGAWILFLILVFWQMPHFYAIAIYRFKDYQAAKLPVLPVKKGVLATKIQILGYIMAFLAANVALTIYGYTGYLFLIVMIIVSLGWLAMDVLGFSTKDSALWARKSFFTSLIIILTLSLMLSISSFI